MRDWYWLRHGPTHAKAMIGWTDLPADLGDTAALARLAAALPAAAPVISSDLIRAVTTADAVQGGRARLPSLPGLREIHFGDWEGLTHTQAEARDPETIYAFWDAPGPVAAPGGESWDAFAARVNAAVARIEAQVPAGPVIVVAHFGAILTQVQRALGLGPREAFAHKIDPLSLTHLRFGPGGAEAVCINHRP